MTPLNTNFHGAVAGVGRRIFCVFLGILWRLISQLLGLVSGSSHGRALEVKITTAHVSDDSFAAKIGGRTAQLPLAVLPAGGGANLCRAC